MNDTKLGAFALIFIVSVAVFTPVFLTDTASAEYSCGCTWQNCLSVVRLLDSPTDYRWLGDWDPRFDTEMHRHYCGITHSDCDARCDLQYSCRTHR